MHEVWLSYSAEPRKWRSVEFYAVDLLFVITAAKLIVVSSDAVGLAHLVVRPAAWPSLVRAHKSSWCGGSVHLIVRPAAWPSLLRALLDFAFFSVYIVSLTIQKLLFNDDRLKITFYGNCSCRANLQFLSDGPLAVRRYTKTNKKTSGVLSFCKSGNRAN